MAPVLSPILAPVDDSHRQQAAAFWRRWRNRRRPPAPPAGARPPEAAPLPSEVWRHYRAFAWVIYEQRLLLLVLGFLLGGCLLVWSLAWHLRQKPPVVVRARPSLKEAATAFYGRPEITYDQMAFFLQGCLPLLVAADGSSHPLLPLVQGLVAPEIYRAAEQELNRSGRAMTANRMTEALTLTGVEDVVSDAASGRAGAYLRGYLTVTVRQAKAEFFPWRARVVLAVNPVSRLNPYPFYLLRCEQRTGPEALAWDRTHESGAWLAP